MINQQISENQAIFSSLEITTTSLEKELKKMKSDLKKVEENNQDLLKDLNKKQTLLKV